MPHVPVWVGNVMENVLASMYLTVKVIHTEYLSEQIKRVCFEGDLKHASYYAGYAVSFRVSDTDFRNYTPAVFDRSTGICEIIFHLHGKGPGSAFGARLKEGDIVKMVIPRGKRMYRDSAHHILFGDETSIGLCMALRSEFDKQGQWYSGIIELDLQNDSVPDKLDLALDTVNKHAYGKCLYISDILNTTFGEPESPHGNITWYLTGNAASIQQFRKLLKERGIRNNDMIVQAYWANGKIGL